MGPLLAVPEAYVPSQKASQEASQEASQGFFRDAVDVSDDRMRQMTVAMGDNNKSSPADNSHIATHKNLRVIAHENQGTTVGPLARP